MSVSRTFVIGDVHGCIDELELMLDVLVPTSDDTVCCLGDYVDRGPSPKAVIDRLIRLRQEGPRCVFLKGNHEDMFLAFLGLPGRHGDAFLWNGGNATLASYGLEGREGRDAAARLPAEHRDFLLSLKTQALLGRFLCVHAGVRPTRRLDQQTDEDLLWIREEFIAHPHPFPCTVLYGHTPQRDVHLHLPFKIGLDTGLVYGNRLSCLELPSGTLWQVARGTRTAIRRDIAAELSVLGAPPA